MFILEESNNETDSVLSAAHFELGTEGKCYGALITIISSGQTLSIPIPIPSGETITVSVKGLRIRQLEAIEYMGRRYTRTLDFPSPGEFYWNIAQESLTINGLK